PTTPIAPDRLARPDSGPAADPDGPRPDAPPRDEAVLDVRVVLGEAFGDRAVLAAEDEHRAVRGLGQGACHDDLASLVRRPRHPEVLLAELPASLEVVIDDVVQQQEVRHQSPVARTASMAALRASRFSLRSLASRWRRCSTSVSATIGGTGRGFPSSSSATN